MSERIRDEENLPPAKRFKKDPEEEEEQVVDECVEQEGEGDEDGQKTDKSDDNFSLLSVLREEDVGITEYISSNKGISAVIKQRYSDFIVNEISSEGEVIHLTNTELPVVIEESEPTGPVDDVLPADFLTQLKQVAAGSIPGQTAFIPVGGDKGMRLRIHRAVKGAFPNLETMTEEKDGQKIITAVLKGTGKDNRKVREWPSSKSNFPFSRFVLYKENKSTMEVIHLIARNLKVKDVLFHYAGTKDRRAKTTQEVTAFKIHPKKLQDLNKSLRNIVLGNFRYVDKELRLGKLGGNRFTIVLRNVIGEDDDIEACLTSLKEVGFINYYGLQRFGTSVCTHHVGRALLKQDWEEAVNVILAGNGSETQAFRKIWMETKDPQKTLKVMEIRNYIERTVLHSLRRRPKDFYGAVQTLPRNTRLIYPHSYQGVIWNTMVSKRIQYFGLKPVVGDLVLPGDIAVTDTEVADADGSGPVAEDEQDCKESKLPRVKPIVLDETTVSQYTIYDVVLPLPGFDVIYPNNEVHSWYKELLKEDGFDIDNMRRKQKDYSLPGGYRAIVVRPKDVDWKTLRYDDTNIPLALSDLDHLNGMEEPQSVPDGKMKALCLSFSLTSSSYATMALRELLKVDTSPAQQASMNVT